MQASSPSTLPWSQSGRVLTDTVTDGSAASASSCTYDGAGRLVKTVVSGHTLAYAYAGTGGCGVNAFAGADGDRTGMTDAPASGAATSSGVCHDWADRVVSSTVTNPVAGADLTGSDLAYDADGDITKLADEVFGWDGAGRHVSTSAGDGTSVNVLRDSTDRVVRQTAGDAGAAATTTRYGFSGGGDAADLVLSGNRITSRVLALPGGVVATLPVSGAASWSYPDVHGDVVATADQSGTRTGRFAYDPFGQPVANLTGATGGAAADRAVPDNLPDAADFAWVGSNQKLFAHAGTLGYVEMGARVFLPWPGRFLTVDPVMGGNENAYTYPLDPVDAFDLNGQFSLWGAVKNAGISVRKYRDQISMALGLVALFNPVGAVAFGFVTAAFVASTALSAASTVCACVNKDWVSCGTGAVILIPGVAGGVKVMKGRNLIDKANLDKVSSPKTGKPNARRTIRYNAKMDKLAKGKHVQDIGTSLGIGSWSFGTMSSAVKWSRS